jgi:hypothetical protein
MSIRQSAATAVFGRAECRDADLADIHQAAARLAEWIRRNADRAAADPIFTALRLASLKATT